MKTLLQNALLAAVAMTVCGVAGNANAQMPNVAQDFQRLQQQFNGGRPAIHALSDTLFYRNPSSQARPIYGAEHFHHPNGVQQLPGQQIRTGAPPVLGYTPQQLPYPVYVSPDRFDGVNPYTGGINTRNEQINNTYYDRYREQSKNNGTRRWVRRPVYDVNGNISGYQEGYVWRNSVTGVEHSELQNVTKNNQGGEHRQIVVASPVAGN